MASQILRSFERIKGLTFSQYGQDVFVGDILCNKKSSYFVDVGARDGIGNSNSFYLEQTLGWKGVLIEPHPDLYQQCFDTRSSPTINCACSNKSDLLKFVKYLEEPYGNSGLLKTFPNPGRLEQIKHEIIDVQTKTLSSILESVNSPAYIDYLDIDVEGHEVQVLESLNLNKYFFRVIRVECAITTEKFNKICKILHPHGYVEGFLLGSDILFMKV